MTGMVSMAMNTHWPADNPLFYSRSALYPPMCSKRATLGVVITLRLNNKCTQAYTCDYPSTTASLSPLWRAAAVWRLQVFKAGGIPQEAAEDR